MNNKQSNCIIKLDGVSKYYKTTTKEDYKVFDNLSFKVNKGEIVALIGPSGSGKSTLLHIAGLLDSYDSGTLEFPNYDKSIKSDKSKTLARGNYLGFIYQFHHLLPEFTVIENVMLPLLVANYSKRGAKSRALAILQELKIADKANLKPNKLSGGEQQRVAIARSLANKPDLLLADEPTGNLDKHNTEVVFSLLKETIKSRPSMGALIATHNLELASQADRVIAIEDGKLVEK